MKKIILFIFSLFFLASLFASEFADYNEEMGIETNSLQTTQSIRTTRDIPEGGLLLIPDSGNDRIMAFDPVTGDLYDADFIPSDPTNLATPISAALHPDGNSILISDQIKDGVIQYDLDGNFMGFFAPAGGVNNDILNNIRGWSIKADGNILVTSALGANTDAIAEFDASGNYLGNFIANGAGGLDGPFCVLYRDAQDDYLVTASTSDAVHQYDNAGNYLGNLIPVLNFGEQITETTTGNLLIAGFSTPSGCHEYTSDGTFVGLYDVVTGLRGVYELPNGNILVTNAIGVYEIDRNNTIVSTKLEGVNARFINFVEGDSGTAFDPPINVEIDDETGILTWLAPTAPVFAEDVDSYVVGDYIAEVSPYFTTWSNAPGGAEDALVTDVVASSGSNSVVVELNQDLIVIMEDYTTGVYFYDMKMYVPTGFCGYFNLQKTSTPGEEWAFQAYYQTNGDVVVDAGAAAALTHSFSHDEWFDIKVIVDLDNDWATYYFNGVEMIGYQWTLGTFGTANLLQFGGANLFGGANSTQPTDVPMYYFDDVALSEVSDEVTGFNVYLDGVLDAIVGDDILDYMFTGLNQGQAYVAGASAVYAGGESAIVEVPFTYNAVYSFVPPNNPAAVVDDYNDIIITWDAPGGYISRSLSGYKIYQDGAEVAEITNAATLTYTDECLDEGTYEYTITAVYTYPPGESIPTDPVNATVVLYPPSNIDAQSQPPNIIVTWGAPIRGIDSYNIYRDGLLHEEGVVGLMFIDIAVPTGTYVYSMTAVYCGGYESDPVEVEVVHVSGDGILRPTVTALTGNYPNPFNPTTTISFSLAEAGYVSIEIYNTRGQLVKILVNTELENAYHEIVWNGKDNSGKTAASGIYFYKMKASSFTSTKKMVLMK